MNSSLLLEVADGIATLSFNRPRVLNALDARMLSLFRQAAERVEADPAVRVLVIRGEGDAFAAGGDVGTFHRNLSRLPELILQWGGEMHHGIQALRRMDKPVLASVHGACAGAGFSILCAADLAIASREALFSLAYAGLGTSPDGGSSYFLPRLVGQKKAMELALLPERFDAAAALTLGLVNWVVPLEALAGETLALARRLANGPTRAYAETKRLVNDSATRTLEAQMQEELFAFARCAKTRDFAEGVGAFVEKRKPRFSGE